MTCNAVHLIEDSDYGCLALVQGESLNYAPGRALTFILTGETITADLTTYTPVGAITSNYADKNPTRHAVFTFQPLLYGTFADAGNVQRTGIAVAPRLTFEESKAIPIPNKLQWTGVDSAKIGQNCWLYEIRLVSPDGKVAIDVVPSSYVQIIGRAV